MFDTKAFLLTLVAGFSVGCFISVIGIAISMTNTLEEKEVNAGLIAECEEFIPRNQHCKLIAVIAEE